MFSSVGGGWRERGDVQISTAPLFNHPDVMWDMESMPAFTPLQPLRGVSARGVSGNSLAIRLCTVTPDIGWRK